MGGEEGMLQIGDPFYEKLVQAPGQTKTNWAIQETFQPAETWNFNLRGVVGCL